MLIGSEKFSDLSDGIDKSFIRQSDLVFVAEQFRLDESFFTFRNRFLWWSPLS